MTVIQALATIGGAIALIGGLVGSAVGIAMARADGAPGS